MWGSGWSRFGADTGGICRGREDVVDDDKVDEAAGVDRIEAVGGASGTSPGGARVCNGEKLGGNGDVCC